MKRTPYKIADEAAAKITKRLHQEFTHNRLALFDETNIIQTKKHIDKLYKDVYKVIKNGFLNVINQIYDEIYEEALALGFDGEKTDLDEGWIEDFFSEYNPVTKYVFKNELGRKKSRLFESLVASRLERHQSYKTAEKLLTRQVKQYAIELEDSVARKAYKDAGVIMVQWVAENDSKTCSVCNDLDGQIFEMKDAPPKQHYNCRCILIPVKK